ncbi:hypothetical protein MIND_00946500 [Mycena indigotica]|uniref:Uncharacterized protein n=1 Tax=Mycena indigotica TaxID=2126181 RepID=A0A8H6VZ32_9AGAR|nr:uncharacterized protein MIND_00946500 [Mycena indigotica]KAF7297136.1 hypothetical protein MIND_00946500 [Mycena indigotica]
MPAPVQPPSETHHDSHSYGKQPNANALHRDALLQALGTILSPKRPALTGRSSSTSTVESSRSSSGTASPAHGHHPTQPHPHSPLAEMPTTLPMTEESTTTPPAPPNTPIAAPRAKIIDSLKSKNGAWDALIHGSFS